MNGTKWIYLVMTAMLVACSSPLDVEEPVKHTAVKQKVTLSVRTQGTLPLEVIDPNDPEMQIRTLRVYAFDMTSNNPHLEGYYYNEYTTATIKDQFEMLLPPGSLIYAIANEDSAKSLTYNGQPFVLPGIKANPTGPKLPVLYTEEQLSPHVKEVSPSMLESLTFSGLPQASYVAPAGSTSLVPPLDETQNTYVNAVLPMAGKSVVTEENIQVGLTLQLDRSVAKLTLHFAKAGLEQDTLYIGRGLYLYNEPPYGYLFPRQNLEFPVGITFNNKEVKSTAVGLEEEEQDGGRIILRSGLGFEIRPPMPDKIPPTTDTTTPAWKAWKKQWEEYDRLLSKAHINQIKVANNRPGDATLFQSYEQLPKRSVYLFANPYTQVVNDDYHPVNPAADPKKGYYLKVTSHEHRTHYEHGYVNTHEGHTHYVALPQVQPNDHLELYSIIRLSNYTEVNSHWLIEDWISVDQDMNFD